MARTAIPAFTLDGAYPVLPYEAGAADFIQSAVDDPTDRDTPLVDSKTVVIAHNTDSAPHTITITGVVDEKNRRGDISAYSIAAGKISRFGPFKSPGWANAGKLQIDVSDPLVRLSIITLP